MPSALRKGRFSWPDPLFRWLGNAIGQGLVPGQQRRQTPVAAAPMGAYPIRMMAETSAATDRFRPRCCKPRNTLRGRQSLLPVPRPSAAVWLFGGDHRGDRAIAGPLALGEAAGNAQTVLDAAVLAHLALAFEAGDRQAQADDALELGPDEGLRRVGDGPWLRALAFVESKSAARPRRAGAARRRRTRPGHRRGRRRSSRSGPPCRSLAWRRTRTASHRRRDPETSAIASPMGASRHWGLALATWP